MSGPQITALPGDRLHLHHGPIDVILWAEGPDRAAAYRAAADRFSGLLEELVGELPLLRSPLPQPLTGETARRMARAVAPHRAGFITPMAAVAGAVADTLLAEMCAEATLSRAYVNNGGDIALHLDPGQSLTSAIVRPGGTDSLTIRHEDPVRGIATSGWRGRSFSLGIADSVTVLAATAAEADAHATIIANAVDLPGHPAIHRLPANQRQADSDLGARLVTVGVGPLSAPARARALDAGQVQANALLSRAKIAGAALFLQSDHRCTGILSLTKEPALA
ncbi:MAG: UPF0280 family protein [Pseudorhodobacter sp.]|nr:UPF0280 family protein [Pseudorhodobacter sp.]